MVGSGMPDETDQKLATEIFNLFQYLGRLREEIASIARQPESETAFEGVSDQLDAIITSTAEATHRVLENIEAIADAANDLHGNPEPAKLDELRAQITEKATQIMEACSFQDLTGQRVSRIIRSMKFVEQRVEAMVEIFGRTAIEKHASRLPVEEVDIKDGMVLHGPDLPGEAISQEEIDNLFS